MIEFARNQLRRVFGQGRPAAPEVDVGVQAVKRTASQSDDMLKFQPVGKYTALGYKATEYLRSTGSWEVGGSADSHMRYDRRMLIDASRALDRNNWLYEAVINRACDYILGPTGFTLQAETGIKGLSTRIEKLWHEWWKNPEARQLFDGQTIEHIVLRELLVAGDTLFLKLTDGLLQHIEAERIASNQMPGGSDDGIRIEQGVRLDKRGRIVGFEIAGADGAQGYPEHTDTTRVDAKNAIYVLNRLKRSSQTRGVPVLVSSMAIAHRLEDILTSEAISWQVMSRLALAVTTSEGGEPVKVTGSATRTGAETPDLDMKVMNVGMATAFFGDKGQEIKGIRQTRPSQHLEASVKLFIRLFGIPLGIPLELILLDWGKLNYSSSRAVLLQAFIIFRAWQKLLIKRFHSRVYRWQVGRWVAQGKLPWRASILEHKWVVPSWPWIDEDKEVQAWGKKMDRGLATQTDALGALSQDRKEFLQTRGDEITDAMKRAEEIAKGNEGLVTAKELWPLLAGVDQGKTLQAVLAGGSAPKKDKDADDKE